MTQSKRTLISTLLQREDDNVCGRCFKPMVSHNPVYVGICGERKGQAIGDGVTVSICPPCVADFVDFMAISPKSGYASKDHDQIVDEMRTMVPDE